MNEPQTQKIARYEILAKVGQGANGVVYRAQDPTIRRVVALKVIPADSAPGPEGTSGGRSSVNFFEREAQAAGALLHPSIVTLYDAGRDGDWYYLAMEFIEGETFAKQLAREGRVPFERVVEIGAVVGDALDFAHERGVVHRDIKPANLMILPDQTVKVADFGIARLTSSAATMTTDMMVGTPHYMSPEQVRGGKVDGRSDLFSLGVVLYESLTGRKPFAAETLPAILNKILNSSPPPPHDVEPSVPPDLSRIVMHAMARERDARYPRGKELASDLRALLASRRAEGSATVILTPQPRSSSRLWATVGGLAAAVVIGAGAYALIPHSRPGYLGADSDPPGAEVYIDGKLVGQTPYTYEVAEGKHEIEYRKDGYYPVPTTVTIKPNEKTEVNLPMTSR